MSCLQIKIYEGNYDRTEFYSIMGKYFAEKKYKEEMPYLENKDGNVWFLAFEDNELLGFGSVEIMKNKALLSHSYVEEEHRQKGIWSAINKERLQYAKQHNKPIEVITKEEFLKDYWLKHGFEIKRKNGSYYYLRKEEIKDE